MTTRTVQDHAATENFCSVVPRANVAEDAAGYRVFLEMPGVGKDSLKVSVDKGYLVVQGRMAASLTGRLLMDEIPLRQYRRVFKLSDHIDHNDVRAQWRDGILEISLSKKEGAKAREIEIHYN